MVYIYYKKCKTVPQNDGMYTLTKNEHYNFSPYLTAFNDFFFKTKGHFVLNLVIVKPVK